MKIIYCTDLHGNTRYYDQLASLASMAEADVVINGGDMLPKDGDLFGQGDFVTGFLAEHFAAMNKAGIHYLCYLGNDDLRIFDDVFTRSCDKYALVTNLAQRKAEISGYEFIGMNWVVDYPFRLKDRCRIDTLDYVFQPQLGTGLLSTRSGWQELPDWSSYARELPTIEDELAALPLPTVMDRTIYVIHMPPFGLGLDECWSGKRVGSIAISRFLEEKQPAYSLHGHIHESPQVTGRWHATVGHTTCVQPGQGPQFTYVVLDPESGELHRNAGATH